MAKLLYGKPVAEAMCEKLRVRSEALGAKGVVPKLAIIRVGENPSDLSYERGAIHRAAMVGAEVEVIALREDSGKEDVLDAVRACNGNAAIHGVLLFRPMPKHLRPFDGEIRNALDPTKDVDGMTDLSCAGVFEGRSDLGFPPCTPQACIEILDHYGVNLAGARATVIGRSLVVGKPLAMLLMGRNATVTACHTRTRDVAAEARRADVLVTSAGALKSLTADFVRPGQVVIDVSINWDADKPNAKGGFGAIAGDADFEAVEGIVDAITPVPGGVGAVTTSVLFSHVIDAAERMTGD